MPERVAIAILRSDPPEFWVAEDTDVLSRVIALKIVANTPPDLIQDPRVVNAIRSALLEEQWANAVTLWIENGGYAVDVYDGVEVWNDVVLDDEQAPMEIRMAPIFSDAG
jgi:hypothetical protein